MSGIKHKHLVHLTITIPIVVGKVYRITDEVEGLAHHLRRMHVIATRIVLTIIRIAFRHCDRSYYIESKIELAKTLINEIIMYRPRERRLIIMLFIKYSVIDHLRMVSLKRQIIKTDKDHQSFLRTGDVASLTNRSTSPRSFGLTMQPLATSFCRNRTTGFCPLVNDGHSGLSVKTGCHSVCYKNTTIFALPIVGPLIASQFHLHGGTISEPYRSPLPALGRYGINGR